MQFTHDRHDVWSSLYRLHFWRWGITLDWGDHRFILCVSNRARWDTGKGSRRIPPWSRLPRTPDEWVK